MKTSLSLALAAALVLGTIFEMSASAAEGTAAAKTNGAPTSVAAANYNNLDSPELRRNAMSLELLGRGFLDSFDYDYQVNNDLAVGAGVSHYSISSGDSNASAWIVPVYANYYLTSGKGRFFATGGANLMFASGSLGEDAARAGDIAECGFKFFADPLNLIKIRAQHLDPDRRVQAGGPEGRRRHDLQAEVHVPEHA